MTAVPVCEPALQQYRQNQKKANNNEENWNTSMEKERFITIWEYVNPSNVSEEEVFKICSIYLGSSLENDDAKSKLRNAIKSTLSSQEQQDDILKKIVAGGNELHDYLSSNLVKREQPKDTLRTILDKEIAEDDD